MSAAYDTLPQDLSASERALRVQLAAAYRIVDFLGWTELIYGHLTVRLPGETPTFLINPYGLNYDEVTASNLVKIDTDGNALDAHAYPVNRAGFVIHSAIHMANSENKCVMHTHTRAGMAVSALAEGLQQVHMYSTGFHQNIAYHDYEGPSLVLDERERLLADLSDNHAMILRNHGLMTVGRTIPEALIQLYRLERACQVQLDAAAAGTLAVIPQSVVQSSFEQTKTFLSQDNTAQVGELEFAALTRKIERLDASYKN